MPIPVYVPTHLEGAAVHVFHHEAQLVLVLVRVVEGDDEGAVLRARCRVLYEFQNKVTSEAHYAFPHTHTHRAKPRNAPFLAVGRSSRLGSTRVESSAMRSRIVTCVMQVCVCTHTHIK